MKLSLMDALLSTLLLYLSLLDASLSTLFLYLILTFDAYPIMYLSLTFVPYLCHHTLRYQIQRSQQTDKQHSFQSTIVYHDVAMREGYQSGPIYRGLWDALVQLRRQYGWRGLYRGAIVRTLFFTPSTALTMAIYEELKVYL